MYQYFKTEWFVDKKHKVQCAFSHIMNQDKQYQWAKFETQFSFGHTLSDQFTSYEDQSPHERLTLHQTHKV